MLSFITEDSFSCFLHHGELFCPFKAERPDGGQAYMSSPAGSLYTFLISYRPLLA